MSSPRGAKLALWGEGPPRLSASELTDVPLPFSSLKVIAENDTYSFAHEAAIWNEDTDDFYFAANAGGALGDSNLDKNNKIWKISLGSYNGTGLLPYTQVTATPDIEMVNGSFPSR